MIWYDRRGSRIHFQSFPKCHHSTIIQKISQTKRTKTRNDHYWPMLTKKKSSKMLFKPEEYEFDFQNCLKVDEMKHVFLQYLKSVHNQESLEFLDRVASFKIKLAELYNEQFVRRSTTDLQQQLQSYQLIHSHFTKLAQEIIDQFLKQESKKQINVSSTEINLILDRFKELNEKFANQSLLEQAISSDESSSGKMGLKQGHYNFFTPVQTVVLTELRLDVFPRFLRSKQFLQYIQTKDINFISNIANKKGSYHNLLYTLEDWSNPVISDHDFELMNLMTEDFGDWILTRTHNADKDVHEQTTLYLMKNKFIVGDHLPSELQKRTLAKITLYLPYDQILVAQTVLSKIIEEKDHVIESTKQLDYIPANIASGVKYSTTYYRTRMRFTSEALLDKREMYNCASAFLDPSTHAITMVSRDSRPLEQKPKHYERGSVFVCHKFQRVSENLCRYTSIYSVNMGGKFVKIGGTLNAAVMKKRCKVYRDQLMKVIEGRIQQGNVGQWVESNGKFETLVDNIRNLSTYYDSSSQDVRNRILQLAKK